MTNPDRLFPAEDADGRWYLVTAKGNINHRG
jgi:hypothetical protein